MGWLRRGKKDAADALRRSIGDYELPSFNQSKLEALAAIRDESSSLAHIAAQLNLDPGLSARVLSLVNSASFGLRHPVDDVPHAVQLLGRAPLESLIISLAVREALPEKPMPGFEPRSFWRAAALRATAARRLAGLRSPVEGARAFTAALLQEMAVPMLARVRGDAYTALLDRWRDGGPELHALEREAFGTDHAEVGGLLCQAWELPETLAIAVGSHHAEAPPDDVPPPVLLVGALRETEPHTGIDAFVEAAERAMGLERDALIELVDASLEEAEDLAARWA